MITLYDHQIKAVNELEGSNERSAFAELCTGSGKSLVAASLAQRCAGRTLILEPNDQLIMQIANACSQLGFKTGVLFGAMKYGFDDRIMIATPHSVVKNFDKIGEFDLIVCDEVHYVAHSDESRYRKIFNHYKNARVRGLTGTGFRSDTGSLANSFGECVYRYTYSQALSDGRVKLILTGGTTEQPIATQSEGEDDVAIESEAIRLAPIHAENLAAHMRRLGCRKVIAICTNNTKHADALADELCKVGLRAAAVHSKLRGATADKRIDDFRSGNLDVLTSCSKFSVGFDVPDVDGVALVRSIQSRVLYMQAIGRGVRRSRYSPVCYVFDFGSCARRLGDVGELSELFETPEAREKYLKVIARINSGERGDTAERTDDRKRGSGIFTLDADAKDVFLVSDELMEKHKQLVKDMIHVEYFYGNARLSLIEDDAFAASVEGDRERSEAFRREWNEAARDYRVEYARRRMADPDYLEDQANRHLKRWSNIEYRNKQLEKQRERMADPKVREEARARVRKCGNDPKNREKRLARHRERWEADAAYREAFAERKKNRAADPEKRAADAAKRRETQRKYREKHKKKDDPPPA